MEKFDFSGLSEAFERVSQREQDSWCECTGLLDGTAPLKAIRPDDAIEEIRIVIDGASVDLGDAEDELFEVEVNWGWCNSEGGRYGFKSIESAIAFANAAWDDPIKAVRAYRP